MNRADAEALIARERQRWPDVAALAQSLTLAGQIDASLIRAMRLALLPLSDPSVESDLWFSPLVQTRASRGLTFFPAVVDALRRELGAGPEATVLKAWAVLAGLHGLHTDDGVTQARVSPALALEETLTFLALRPTAAALSRIDLLLGRARASLLARPDSGMARWAIRTLPRLPDVVRASPAAMALARAASGQLGGIAVRGVLTAAGVSGTSPAVMAGLPTIAVGARLIPAGLELSQPPADATSPLPVPDTTPLVLDVDVPGTDGWRTVRTTLERDSKVVVELPAGPMLRLRTLAGTEWHAAPLVEGHVRALWLIDRSGDASGAERLLRNIGDEIGWSVARFAEGIGAEHAVVVWRFANPDDLRQRASNMPLADNELQSIGRLTVVWAGAHFTTFAAAAATDVRELLRRAGEQFGADAEDRSAGDPPGGPLPVSLFNKDTFRSFLLDVDRQRASAQLIPVAAPAALDLQAAVTDAGADPLADGQRALIGRDDVIAELHAATFARASGLICLVGSGGTGKSAIARGLAARNEFAGATVVYQGAGTSSPSSAADFARHVGRELDRRRPTPLVSERGPSDDLDTLLQEAATLREYGPAEPLLLVFDGFDGQDRDSDPIAVMGALLPQTLPAGAWVVITARTVPASLEGRGSVRLVLNLDDERWRASADAAIAAYWDSRQPSRAPLADTATRDTGDVVRYCAGSFRCAEMLGRWLDAGGKRVGEGVWGPTNPVTGSASPLRGIDGVVEMVTDYATTLTTQARVLFFQMYRLLAIAMEPLPLDKLLDAVNGPRRRQAQDADGFADALRALWPLLSTENVPLTAEAIVAHFRRTHDMLIGERTAKQIQIELNAAAPFEAWSIEVKGRRLTDSRPVTVTVSSDEIRAALEAQLVDRRAIVAAFDTRFPFTRRPGATSDADTYRGHAELLGAVERLRDMADGSPASLWAASYLPAHGLTHATAAGNPSDVFRLISSIDFLIGLIEARGYQSALQQLLQSDVVTSDLPSQSQAWPQPALSLVQIVREYGAWLSHEPSSLRGIAYDHLRRLGSPAQDVTAAIGVSSETLPLHLHSPLGTPFELSSRLLEGHTAPVAQIAASDTRLLTAGDDFTVRVWDLPDQRLLWTVATAGRAVTALALDRFALWGDAEGMLHVCDLESGRQLATHTAHRAAVVCCAIRPVGTDDAPDFAVLSSGDDGSFFIGRLKASGDGYELEAGDASPASGQQAAPALAIDIVEDRLVRVARDGRVESWSPGRSSPVVIELGRTVRAATIAPDSGEVSAVSREGRVLQVMPDDSSATVRISESGLLEPDHCVAVPGGVAISQAHNLLLTGPLHAGRAERPVTLKQRGRVRGIVVAATGAERRSSLYAALDDNTVTIADALEGRVVGSLGDYGRPVALLDIEAREQLAAFPVAPNELAIHDLSSDERWPTSHFEAPITACRFLPRPGGGSMLCVGLSNGRVLGQRDGTHSSFEMLFDEFPYSISALEWFDDGALVATFPDGELLRVSLSRRGDYRLTSGELRGPLTLATLAPGRVLAASAGGELVVWNGETVERRLIGGGPAIRSLDVEPGSGLIAAGLADGSVVVVEPDRDRRQLARFEYGIGACAITAPASGRPPRILCGLDNGDVAIVPLDGGTPVAMLRGHGRAINGLLAGSMAASWSLDGSIRVWDLERGVQAGAVYGRAPFIAVRNGAAGDERRPALEYLYALDALGQAWQLKFSPPSPRSPLP